MPHIYGMEQTPAYRLTIQHMRLVGTHTWKDTTCEQWYYSNFADALQALQEDLNSVADVQQITHLKPRSERDLIHLNATEPAGFGATYTLTAGQTRTWL